MRAGVSARLGWSVPRARPVLSGDGHQHTGADAWTFVVPALDYELNGYFTIIKHDDQGWLDVAGPCLSDTEPTRNADGTISVWFGDHRVADRPNVIEATEGQRFYYGIRLYRPLDVRQTRDYIDILRRAPPVHPG